ncbi:HEAT repeat domain-containing protein [Nannocystis punicea]|uniref:HEAT repeat domain-containing protein n=1 Tax=Nannocystis punicea TaxID=2995304 RepID=A0ABY7H5B9_9BACT|nr:HEAT repeat domain-containing protein [Nannocystis poenicansa]WAS94270.1 HEAT repeat domain-containing protein [Nannocystis poenicansa]
MKDFRATMEEIGTPQDCSRLWQYGIETYEDLLALAEGEHDVDLRRSACWYLARLGGERAFTAFARCLEAEEERVRCGAALSLGELGGEQAMERLIQCLEADPDADVRWFAAHGLGEIGDKRAFVALRTVLRRSEEDPRVRGMAAEALAYIGDRRGVGELVKVLGDPSPELRYWVVFALGQIGNASLIPKLLPMLEDHASTPEFGSVADEVAATIEILKEKEGENGG